MNSEAKKINNESTVDAVRSGGTNMVFHSNGSFIDSHVKSRHIKVLTYKNAEVIYH